MVVRTGTSGSYTWPFALHADGSLVASKATITGKITATSGSFTGKITATSGEFTGTVKVGSILGDINVGTQNSRTLLSGPQHFKCGTASLAIYSYNLNGQTLYRGELAGGWIDNSGKTIT